jgi:membrane-bound metal-dependent hydrolase YbcI (DUF457 family)
MALAVLAHVLADQAGAMGCNLLFPLTRSRTPGLGWMRSGDVIPNFLTVWTGLAILFLNLDRFSPAPLIPVGPYLLVAVAAPGLVLVGLAIWDRFRGRRSAELPPKLAAVTAAAVEALDETGEVDI